MSSGLLLAGVALAPILLVSLLVFDRDARAAASFGLGALGWLAALLARIPLLSLPVALYGLSAARAAWYPMYSAALSGFFEEPVRYAAMRVPGYATSWRRAVSLGLGWSFMEALFVYAVPVLVLGPAAGALPGAVERLSATVAHLAFTVLVALSIRERRPVLLLLAVLLHSSLNISALTAVRAGLGAWQVEAVIAALAAALLGASLLARRWLE